MIDPADGLADSVTFTAAGALDVLAAVCASAGVSVAGAQVLQQPADNAVIAVPSIGLVARIGVDVSHLRRLEQELRVASWLAANGVATPLPATDPPSRQLAVEGGRVLTWWEYLPTRQHGDLLQLMQLLRQLHQIPAPPPDIAAFDPWARVEKQIAAATGLAEKDRGRLRRQWEVLRSRWTSSRWPFEPGVVIHGDAHVHNTLVHGGRIHLIDLEDVRLGPWQWDAIVPLVQRQLGWISGEDYWRAAEAYGRDPCHDDDIDVLVSIRLLRMTCWLASRSGREPEVVDVVRRRIASLEDRRLLGQWLPA